MQTINTIIENSSIGSLSKKYQSAILLVFSAIVFTLISMLIYIMGNTHSIVVSFGY